MHACMHTHTCVLARAHTRTYTKGVQRSNSSCLREMVWDIDGRVEDLNKGNETKGWSGRDILGREGELRLFLYAEQLGLCQAA